MKKYFYSTAYFVIGGLLLATIQVVIPDQINSLTQGKVGLSDVFFSIMLIPFIAGAIGSILAGTTAVITGFCMAFFNRFSILPYLLATLILSVLLELGSCYILQVKHNLIPHTLIITTITTLCLSISWRLWLNPRID